MSNKFEYSFPSPIGYIRLTVVGDALERLDFLEAEADNLALNQYPQTMKTAVSELTLYFEGKLREFSVNCRQTATPFRMRVYNELLNIPYGKTISYKELASKIGSKTAVRAVGGANGSNCIPIIYPCHRVISSDGGLSGYSGGVWRKQKLLELEGVTI